MSEVGKLIHWPHWESSCSWGVYLEPSQLIAVLGAVSDGKIAFIIQENSCPWTQLHRLLSEFPPPSIHIDLISFAILRWTCCLSCSCWTAPENPMSHSESLFQVPFFILTCLGRHLSPGSELLTPLWSLGGVPLQAFDSTGFAPPVVSKTQSFSVEE